MQRSIPAVLFGTFTLRFSTGLTGALLLFYLARLPDHGGPTVTALEAGTLAAAYFLAELILSTPLGVLADRLGMHRVMQWGPIFGAVAVVMTGLTTNLPLLGATRLLEGAAAAASIPSILGYLAHATSHDEALRGRTVARFEAATLAGIGLGAVAAGFLYSALGRNAFFLNAAIYAVSFVIYRYGVAEPRALPADADEEGGRLTAAHAGSFDLGRYRRVLGTAGVWLLAPTWIALNAVVGAWTTQSIFQLVKDRSTVFPDQLLMGGFTANEVGSGMAVWLLVFFAGLLYWGNRFKRNRRTTIIFFGILGGLVQVVTVFLLNHSAGWPIAGQVGLALMAAAGLFVLAGATPAALGLLADISEHHPQDRGAVMGLYSVFLALGQITGALAAGAAASWRGIDGILAASLALLVIALLPVQRLRANEHLVVTEEHRARREALRPPSAVAGADESG